MPPKRDQIAESNKKEKEELTPASPSQERADRDALARALIDFLKDIHKFDD